MDMMSSGPHLTGPFARNTVAANRETFMSAACQTACKMLSLSFRRTTV